MKIAITGHTKGLGKFLFDSFSKKNDVIGFSRSNGHHISTFQNIINKAIDVDVFINLVYLETYQSKLFNLLFKKWVNETKTIININSSSIFREGGWNPEYVADKKHLQDTTDSLIWSHPNKKVRVFNLHIGPLETHKGLNNFNKISSENIYNIINWMISQPSEIELRNVTIIPTTEKQ